MTGLSPETLGRWLPVLVDSPGAEACLLDSEFSLGFVLCHFSVVLCSCRNEFLSCAILNSRTYIVYNSDWNCVLSFPLLVCSSTAYSENSRAWWPFLLRQTSEELGWSVSMLSDGSVGQFE